jgi:hypothetical protein
MGSGMGVAATVVGDFTVTLVVPQEVMVIRKYVVFGIFITCAHARFL